MAKVTWLGEGDDGPKETQQWGKTFKVGEAVDIDDPFQIEKARNNRFFKVTGAGSKVEAEKVETVTPPSREPTAQGPVPKPGEPIRKG